MLVGATALIMSKFARRKQPISKRTPLGRKKPLAVYSPEERLVIKGKYGGDLTNILASLAAQTGVKATPINHAPVQRDRRESSSDHITV